LIEVGRDTQGVTVWTAALFANLQCSSAFFLKIAGVSVGHIMPINYQLPMTPSHRDKKSAKFVIHPWTFLFSRSSGKCITTMLQFFNSLSDRSSHLHLLHV
jgi:hypothetical protein